MKSSVSYRNKKWGFTLVELIVVMTISTVIMTALVIQQSRWNDSLVVRTQAYELVLMIRQAQIYSLGVREDVGGTGDKFNIGYGVHINTVGNPRLRYEFFADRDGDKQYDKIPNESIATESKDLTRGVYVYDVLCTVPPSCPGSLKGVDITFLRPSPNASIIFTKANGDILPLNPPVSIKIRSANDLVEAVVIVEANGQVSIK